MIHLIKISFFGFFIILFGCQTKSHEESVYHDTEEFKFPVIIDTSDFMASKKETNWLSVANYNFLYIGEWKDTIFPDYTLKYYPIVPSHVNEFNKIGTTEYNNRLTEHLMYPYYIDWMAPNNHKSWEHAEISIVVDTTQRVKNDDEHDKSESLFFEAYPVLIKNIDTDTVTVGYGEFIPIIKEAKDSTGEWKPIEEDWIYTCGVGVGTVILPPNEIGLSATMIYHGNYTTTLRLKIDSSTYSNEFKGSINYRQFESMFNEKGGYKKEYKAEME